MPGRFAGLIRPAGDFLGELPGNVLRQLLKPFGRAFRHALRQAVTGIGRGSDNVFAQLTRHPGNRVTRAPQGAFLYRCLGEQRSHSCTGRQAESDGGQSGCSRTKLSNPLLSIERA